MSQDFHIHISLLLYVMNTEIHYLKTTGFELLICMDIDFVIHQVEFITSELWTSKCVQLRKSLEDEKKKKSVLLFSTAAHPYQDSTYTVVPLFSDIPVFVQLS